MNKLIQGLADGATVYMVVAGSKTTNGPVVRDAVVCDDPAFGKTLQINGRTVSIPAGTMFFTTAAERDEEAGKLHALAEVARAHFNAGRADREAAQIKKDLARENRQIRREIDEINDARDNA